MGTCGTTAYIASKHGVTGLTKAAALEYAEPGIGINAVCPGYIRTPLLQPILDRYRGSRSRPSLCTLEAVWERRKRSRRGDLRVCPIRLRVCPIRLKGQQG